MRYNGGFDCLIKDYKDGRLTDRQLLTYVKNIKEFKDEIVKRTSFLDNYELYDIVERLYYIVNNLTDVVRCKYCGNKATWCKRGLKEGYREICSSKECKSKNLSDAHESNTLISENRDKEFIEWQNNVTKVNDEIIKENIKYDKFIPMITNPIILDYLKNRFKDSESIEETLKRIELGIEEKPKCALPGCNNPVTFIGRKRAMFSKFCCPAHSAQSEETRQKCKQTNLEHWGTENVYDSKKYRQKMLEEYGVEYTWQREDVIEKRNMTCLERYGTIYPSKVKEIMDKIRKTTFEHYGYDCMFDVPEIFELSHSEETVHKIRETNLNKFGCISPLGSPDVRKTIGETNKERYGEEYILNLDWVREKAHSEESREKQRQTNQERYGFDSPLSSPEIREKLYQSMKANAKFQKSLKEDEVAEYISSLGYQVERHYRTNDFPFNVDIYLPEYNLRIEYQGSHFHNTYSFMGTKEDFDILESYYDKSQKLKKESGDPEKTTQYDNMIYVWSDLDVRKRVFAQENHIRYFEIYKQDGLEYIGWQLKFLLDCIDKKNLFNIPEYALQKEFKYYKNVVADELVSTVGRNNSIVKQFQCTEFYKYEMEIFATEPNTRRKLIQNRCKYLNKKEWELTPNDLLTGFKKSGIYYGYSHFNPLWTNWFVHKYDIHTVYDPCGGWGHHMLGMLYCDRIIYNDINQKVADNICEMKDYFSIDNLEVHCSDACSYVPEDVDAFFMCPPYFNVEHYENDFDSIESYKDFLNKIFEIWQSKNRASLFGLIIREDFISLIDMKPCESFPIDYGTSHFAKMNDKKNLEYFYIFKKD